MKKKILILQHEDCTPPGTTLDWLKDRQWNFEIVLSQDIGKVPEPKNFSGIIVLGGTQNIDEEDKFPWIKEEKSWLKLALSQDVPCFGICLGGQLLASLLGAWVGRNPHWEVGWHEVETSFPEAHTNLRVFQWHAYGFSLPRQAHELAKNDRSPCQGFRKGCHIGLQFHPESTASWIRETLATSTLRQGPFVQDPKAILEELRQIEPMTKWYFQLLDDWVLF